MISSQLIWLHCTDKQPHVARPESVSELCCLLSSYSHTHTHIQCSDWPSTLNNHHRCSWTSAARAPNPPTKLNSPSHIKHKHNSVTVVLNTLAVLCPEKFVLKVVIEHELIPSSAWASGGCILSFLTAAVAAGSQRDPSAACGSTRVATRLGAFIVVDWLANWFQFQTMELPVKWLTSIASFANGLPRSIWRLTFCSSDIHLLTFTWIN